MHLRWALLLVTLGIASVQASPAAHAPAALVRPVVLAQVGQASRQLTGLVLQMPDSLRSKLLVMISQGEVAEAIALWEAETGRRAPEWLRAFEAAFSAANQRAGPCINVARSVFEGSRRLGANPGYIRFTSAGEQGTARLIGFELRAGDPRSTVQISENAVHYAVQVKDRIHDAMTGPTGLTVAEYMKRLVSPGTLTLQEVSELP